MPQHFHFKVKGDIEFDMVLNIEDSTQNDVAQHFLNGECFEHETSLAFLHVLRPGDAAVDVGANAGYFTMLSAATVGPTGRVVSVEANPRNAEQVRHNAVLSHAAHVTVENLAVSDRVGTVVFSFRSDHDSNGSILVGKPVASDLKPNEFVIKSEPLAEVLARNNMDRIKLLKVDTEGHELAVLRGTEPLLAAGAIEFIVCELNLPGLAENGTDQHALRDFVGGYGYQTFLLDHDGHIPKLVPPKTEIVQQYTCNIFFAKLDSVQKYWPTVKNEPAAIRIQAK